uniref:Uncharacterized mitochondrial protein ORF2 n=1 Tax=Ascobolus immersus TaxID=5191 RepID=YPA2_ASCIM
SDFKNKLVISDFKYHCTFILGKDKVIKSVNVFELILFGIYKLSIFIPLFLIFIRLLATNILNFLFEVFKSIYSILKILFVVRFKPIRTHFLRPLSVSFIMISNNILLLISSLWYWLRVGKNLLLSTVGDGVGRFCKFRLPKPLLIDLVWNFLLFCFLCDRNFFIEFI